MLLAHVQRTGAASPPTWYTVISSWGVAMWQALRAELGPSDRTAEQGGQEGERRLCVGDMHS